MSEPQETSVFDKIETASGYVARFGAWMTVGGVMLLIGAQFGWVGVLAAVILIVSTFKQVVLAE